MRLSCWRWSLACGVIILVGCAAKPTPAPKATRSVTRPTSQRAAAPLNLNTDPCATRLHDICGALLLYYSKEHKLPAKLADLSSTAGFSAVGELSCPESHQPYLYFPDAIEVRGVAGPVIAYDPVASHAGHRWGIMVVPGEGPLVAKVIALPQSWNP